MTDSAGRDNEDLTVSDRFDRRFFLKGIGGVSLAGGALASSAAAGAESDDDEEAVPEGPAEFKNLGVQHGCPGHLDGGRIIILNDNEAVVNVTATGPDGYEETIEIQIHDVGQFEPLDDGEYHLATDRDDFVFERTTVEIDCPTEAEFVDLRVDLECVDGRGLITVSNDNDETVNVTVTGPDGYDETKEVPAGGSTEFAGLENGTYELETSHEDIGLNRTSVDIDY